MNNLKLRLALAIMSGRKGALHMLTPDEMAVFEWGPGDQPQGYIWRNILNQCEGAVYEALMLFGHEHAEPEPVCASLEVAAPPRIVGYQVVARDSISDLELMVNQMIGYGWQPYGTPITTHGFWYQPMVKRATSGTGNSGESQHDS